MIRIRVDGQGRPQGVPTARAGESLLVFGDGLLALPRLGRLLRELGQGEHPLVLATDRLRATADPPETLVAAGLQSIEVPLPTADPRLFDRLARKSHPLRHTRSSPAGLASTSEGLDRTVELAQGWWRAGAALLLRIPVGAHNRAELPGLTGFINDELPGVTRVLFHCSPSLGNRPDGGAAEPPLAELPRRLYDAAVELESARLQVAVEHRDGFGLCLFAAEAEPLRYFHPEPRTPDEAGEDPVWLYPVTAPASQLVHPDACDVCGLRARCPGLHRGLLGKPGVGRVTPFATGSLSPPGRRPPPSIFTGAPRRLRGVLGLAEARQHSGSQRAAASPEPREVAPQDMRALELDRIRLDGFHLVLVRVPWLGSAPEPLVPSLALTALVPFLRSAGARVDPVDAKLQLGRSAVLTALMERAGERRTDTPREADLPRAGTDPWEDLAQTLVARWPASADLLGLSLEVSECVGLAASVARAWKRRGGGAVVVGGRGMGDPRRLLSRVPELDYCVHGEGEVPLLLLADALRGGRPLAEVPGLLYRDARDPGHLTDTHSVVHSLDLHPAPDLSGLPLDDYEGVASLGVDAPAFLYQFIVGCPHACAFCGEHNRYRYRVRSPELVVRDLRFLVEELDRERLFFVNNLINVSRRYLDAWLDAMESAALPLRWCDCCRPAGIHETQLRRLRRVGCHSLTWGLDMLSPALNKRLWKNLSLERAAGLLRVSRDLGIRNAVNVIMGMPTETPADVQETIRFLLRHADCFDEVSVGVYGFRKSSPLARWPARFGLRRVAHGVDEVGGRSWETLLAQGLESQRSVMEAVRQAVPVVVPGQE